MLKKLFLLIIQKTYELYGYQSAQVFHVHGSIGNENIVIGYNDEDEKLFDFSYFKKYFQTEVKKIPIFGSKDCLLDYKGNTAILASTIYFYGHSLDITDEDKLQIFFNEKFQINEHNFDNNAKYIIFYLNDADKENKLINLIRLLTKDKVIRYRQSGRLKFLPIETQ